MGFFIGKGIQTKFHSHHALEIVLALDNPFVIHREKEMPVIGSCSFIASDFPHSFIGQDDVYLFLFLDPELSFAKQLEARFNISQAGVFIYEDLHTSWAIHQLQKSLKVNASTPASLHKIVIELLQRITQIGDVEKNTDPRISEAIRLIGSSLHDEISLKKIASQVFLSASRFAHLFSQQTGIPFRRYVLWCRMQGALLAVIKGQSFTQAAYEGGFSDVAHLSRTFVEMFGVSPTTAFKQ